MAQPYVLTSTYGIALQDFYDRKLLERALPNLVHLRYGVEKEVPPHTGATIVWRKLNPIAMATVALVEGTSVYGSVGGVAAKVGATFTSISVAVSQYGQYTDFSDLVETQAFDDVIGEFVEAFGESMGRTLDVLVRDAVISGASKQYVGNLTNEASLQSTTNATPAASYYLDSAELLEAVNTLKSADAAPLEGGRWIAIVDPDVVRDLFQDTSIVQAFQYAQERGGANPLFSGVLGDYMGIRFVETTHAGSLYSPTSGLHNYVNRTLIIGKDAYAVTRFSALTAQMIIHPRGGNDKSDPLEQISQAGWKAAIAAKVLDSTKVVCISSLSSSVSVN